MEDIEDYINELEKKAQKYLSKEYNLDEFRPTNFELANFFLLDKAINKEQNLFLQINGYFGVTMPVFSVSPCQ